MLLHRGALCRDLVLETDILPQCHGSARATIPLDNTDVLASVKVEIDSPDEATPDRGSIEVSAACWASMSSAAVGRAGDDFAAQLTRSLEGCVGAGRVVRGAACLLQTIRACCGH